MSPAVCIMRLASELSFARCHDGLGNPPDDRGRQLERRRERNCPPHDESLARHGLPPILQAPRIGAEPDMSEKHRTDDLRIEDISDLLSDIEQALA